MAQSSASFHESEDHLTPATRDSVMDFDSAEGDKVDVSTIDANAVLAGNQAFTFIGTAAFSANATGH